VLIVCGAGASSTFLALRLRQIMRARELDLVVEAGSLPDLDDRLAATRILLVGPHLEPRFGELSERAAQAGAVAALLPDDVFGRDGADSAADVVEQLMVAAPRTTGPITAEQTQGDTHG
jgi:PTS system cellobiose-specific IIB component